MFVLNIDLNTEKIDIKTWKQFVRHVFSSFLDFVKLSKQKDATQCSISIQCKNSNVASFKYMNAICLKTMWECMIQKKCIDHKKMDHVSIMRSIDPFNQWEHDTIQFELFHQTPFFKTKITQSEPFIVCWSICNYIRKEPCELYSILSQTDCNVFLFEDFIYLHETMNQENDQSSINPLGLNFFYDFNVEDKTKSEQWLPFEKFKQQKSKHNQQQTRPLKNDWSILDRRTGIVFVETDDHVTANMDIKHKNKWCLQFLSHASNLGTHAKENYMDCLIDHIKMYGQSNNASRNISQNLYCSFIKYCLIRNDNSKYFLFCNHF